MAAKRTSPSDKAYYANYKASNRYASNRKRKLLKAQKEQPNNAQIDAALKNISYRRKTPGTSIWSHTRKNTAKLIKEVVGKMDINIFNTNLVIANTALGKLKSVRQTTGGKVSFKLGDRAHDVHGNTFVWK